MDWPFTRGWSYRPIVDPMVEYCGLVGLLEPREFVHPELRSNTIARETWRNLPARRVPACQASVTGPDQYSLIIVLKHLSPISDASCDKHSVIEWLGSAGYGERKWCSIHHSSLTCRRRLV